LIALPPASGAWRPGDPVGDRRFTTLFGAEPLALEAGGSIGPVVVAYETWGHPDADRSNAILVLHALTGDSHATGPAGPGHRQEGWWAGLIGPGRAIDTDRWFLVCPNVLGGCQGTTGPASAGPDGRPYGSRFPVTTIRDQVAVEAALARSIGIARWAAVIGGSMGGMRALEWAVGHPDQVGAAILLATCAEASAEQIALCSLQIQAIRMDARYRGGDFYGAADGEGPHEGMALARRIGHLSYRSEPEMLDRFGRSAQAGEDPLSGGRYSVESYLDHHAEKLLWRFDANTYIALSSAMNHHDVGRRRGGRAAALSKVTAEVTLVGIDSDRLYPLRQQYELSAGLPGRPGVHVVRSAHGHDGFLVEEAQVGEVVAAALGRIAPSTAPPALSRDAAGLPG